MVHWGGDGWIHNSTASSPFYLLLLLFLLFSSSPLLSLILLISYFFPSLFFHRWTWTPPEPHELTSTVKPSALLAACPWWPVLLSFSGFHLYGRSLVWFPAVYSDELFLIGPRLARCIEPAVTIGHLERRPMFPFRRQFMRITIHQRITTSPCIQ